MSIEFDIITAQSSNFGVFTLASMYYNSVLYKIICCGCSFESPRLGIEKKKIRQSIAKPSLNTPIINSSADLSFSGILLGGYFATPFSSNFEKITKSIME